MIYVIECSSYIFLYEFIVYSFLYRVLQFLFLHLYLSSISSLFLCMVLESVLVSFFYMWLASFPST